MINKSLVCGIIALFVGASVISIISANHNEISTEYLDAGSSVGKQPLEDAETGDENIITMSFSFDPPVITENMFGQPYHSVKMPGLINYGDPGEPMLPLKFVNVLLPYGETEYSIEVFGGNKVFVDRDGLVIEPGQKSYPLSEYEMGEIPEFTLPDERIYTSVDPFPGALYADSGVQEYRGYSILNLNLYPVQYIPLVGQIYYYDQIGIQVSVKARPIESSHENYRGFDKRILELVDNPEHINTYPEIIRNDGEIYEYVIITTDEYNDVFQRLTDWKETRGLYTSYSNLSTRIVLLEDIVSNSSFWYNGCWGDGGNVNIFNDTQCQIRNFIKLAYNNWSTEYVLLGGDADPDALVIPHRGVYCDAIAETDYDIPCDMYYGCLDGTWNDDSDNKWGEIGQIPFIDESDLFAEVYIGRAPVNSLNEADNFVNKTIAYENATAHNESYLQNALMIGARIDDKTEGGNSKDAVTKIIPQYTTTRVYHRDSTYSKNCILEEMENGTHIVNYDGHADNHLFTYPDSIEIQDVSQLTNDNYSLIYSVGCYSAAFDNRMYDGSYTDDAVGEVFVVSSGGAFAYIGNSRYGWYSPGSISGEGDVYDRSFFQTLMGQTTSLGKTLQYSKERYSASVYWYAPMRWTYYNLNLLGDPETQIKTNISAPTARFDTPIDYGEYILFPPSFGGTVDINGTARGGNAPSSTFDHYTVEYGDGLNPATWLSHGITLNGSGMSEIIEGALATLDTSQLSNGPYTFRLTVYDEGGRVGRDWFVVMVANESSVHNIDKDTFYWTIQAAVDDADEGNMIYVGSRYYYEHVMIDKPLTLVSEDIDTTIIDGFGQVNVVKIRADGVKISNFTIQHSGIYPDDAGIYLRSNHNIISGNMITDNPNRGIYISSYASNSTISGNTITDNDRGIRTYGSPNNNIFGNNFTNNNYGIYLKYSPNNNIFGNLITNNDIYGIALDSSSRNIISGNLITNNDGYGISLRGSSNNNIFRNIITNNDFFGIWLSSSSNNNTISGNLITNNDYYGIYLYDSSDNNMIHHNNFINNTQNAYDTSTNSWDDGISEGNYWSDFEYNPGYPNTYYIPGKIPPNQDRYPLMSPLNISLFADANGPYYEQVNKSIQFTGFAFYGSLPYLWHWDFGDGNTSDEQNPVHSYIQPGEYTVTLTVTDNKGNTANNTTTATITLVVDAHGPYTGLVDEPIQFTGSAEGGAGSYNWSWDFGDGNTSNLSNPIYTYNEPGEYTVTLTVTDSLDNIGMDTTTAVIIPFIVYVDDDYDETIPGWGVDHFNTIQDAIDAVAENGNVTVHPGNYENIVVSKPVNLLGEDKDTTIIDGSGNERKDVVQITANRVNISGFTIQNSRVTPPIAIPDSAIKILSEYNTITENIITNNDYGIYLYDSSNNNISWNIITNNDYGISLKCSSNNNITGNSITDNNKKGIDLASDLYGNPSDNNHIYRNNFINNIQHAYDKYGNDNLWDDGYPSGGNYWDDYNGSDIYHGPNQNISGSDGIGDNPYNISGGNNQDRYPLMDPWIRCGDANADGIVDIADVVYVINYLFRGGPAPQPVLCVGDCNHDGEVTLGDIVYLINYLYREGPAPEDCCG